MVRYCILTVKENMTEESNEVDFSDSELQDFMLENERLLLEENVQAKTADQCYCGIASTSSKVIRCDNEECSRQWFHYECVGLEEEPVGEWYCCLKCVEQSAVSSSAHAQEEVEKMLSKPAQSTSGSSSDRTGKESARGKVKMSYPAKKKIAMKDVTEAANEHLDTALKKIANSYIMKMSTPLALAVQSLVSKLEEQKGSNEFIMFCKMLISKLWEVVDSVRGKSWSEDCKHKMWQQFHALRCEEDVKEKWHLVLQELSICTETDEEVFTLQVLTKEVYRSLLTFIMESDLPPKDLSANAKSLDVHEENALRYACGYVPHKLKKCYRGMIGNEVAAKFADVLEGWGDSNVYGDSFLNYTKEWLELQSRGGLFKVNDDVFKFFRAAELVVRSVLYLKNMDFIQNCDIQQVLLSEMLKDERVVSRWGGIVFQLSAHLSQKLLEDVLKCYIKMRCEAFVKVYLMLLKAKQAHLSKKSEKGLRKELQK